MNHPNSTELQFSIFRPGGNNTALVTTIIRNQYQRKKIAALIQKKHTDVEQVGFVNLNITSPELLMAGGEFCGNATSCAAFQILNGKHGEIQIVVSGVKNKLKAGVTKDGEAYSQMPIFTNPAYITPDKTTPENMLVEIEGITHYIDFNVSQIQGLSSDEIKKKAYKKMVELKINKKSACGIIYAEKKGDNWHISPIVYVRNVDTLYYETACGSGTTALGLAIAKIKKTSLYKLSVIQPTGEPIKISVNFDGKKFVDAHIQSNIKHLYQGFVELDNINNL